MAGQATHVPLRTCLGCRARKPKANMKRVVAENDKVITDPKQIIPGRGAYVCSDDCYNKLGANLEKIIKRKRR